MENLCVVYRSHDFLVVNKHWDVRIDSKAWRETLTLQKQLRHRFPELADPDTYYGNLQVVEHLQSWLTQTPTTGSGTHSGFHWGGSSPTTQPPLSLCPILGSATNWTSPPAGHSVWL